MESVQTKPQKWKAKPETKREKCLCWLIENNWPKIDSQLIKDYLTHLVDKEQFTPDSIYTYYCYLNRFAILCRDASGLNKKAPMDTILLYIEREAIAANIEKLKSKCNAIRTFQTAVSIARMFYDWLLEQGYIDHNPVVYYQPPRPKRPTITLEQIKLKRKEPPEGISIIEAVEKWLIYSKRHSKHTQRHYRDNILWFVDGLPDDVKTIDQLTSAHLRDYITNLLGKGLKNSSINSHFVAVQSFCRWLSEQYDDIDNVSVKVRTLKAEPPESRFLEWEEYKKVLAVCRGRERDIIELLGNTGLRSSELLNLRWGNISTDYTMLNLTGKGKKFRHIPCNDVVKSILRKHPRQADSEKIQLLEYFPNRDILYSLCRRLSRHAGIKRFGAHAIRHFFATELLKRGVPIAYVSKVLGHSSIVITERLYVHWQPEFLNGITDVLLSERGGTI